MAQAVRSSDPKRVLCSYHEALGAHRLAHAIRAAAVSAAPTTGSDP